ncbi:nonstructural protein 1 [Duck-associated ambidensovirus 2]|nr:nonstructural protein 1 [Duck-associated ambidensovirus 2]
MDSGVVVPNNQQCNTSSEGRVFSYGYVPLRELEDSDPQNFESLVKLFEPIGDNFFGKLVAKDWTSSGTYISNVIVFSDYRERDVLHKYLIEQGELFRRDLFGFSFDNDHVHIIHSCAFSSSQCKCLWRKKIPCGNLRPGYRYRSELWKWGRRDFLGAVLYFFFRKGGRKESWFEGRCQGLEDNLKSVQWEKVEEKVRNLLGPLEDKAGHDLRGSESDEDFGGPTSGKRKRRDGYQEVQKNQKRRLTKWQLISRKVSELLETTAICPLEGIKSEKCFLMDDFLTDPDNSNKINEAIKMWSYKINHFTLREFFNMYENGSKTDLIFSRSKTYYSLEESTKLLDRLLIYQFDDDELQIKDFLQNLVNVVDFQPEDRPGSNIKCNTFLVYSQPSAGKNFFFDTLFALCLNLGQLGTANKSNCFAFQDAANRRIILWNEPNYESSMTDYLKTLFEGGDTKVRVKMVGDTHVKRTPIIILTNNYVNFMSDIAFTDRIKQYTWKAAPFLKDYLLKPYPLSFFNILLKYKIKF